MYPALRRIYFLAFLHIAPELYNLAVEKHQMLSRFFSYLLLFLRKSVVVSDIKASASPKILKPQRRGSGVFEVFRPSFFNEGGCSSTIYCNCSIITT